MTGAKHDQGGTAQHVDVVVVGGGPTGMTLAGDLARLGRSVVVLERWPQVNPTSRALATTARTLEVLDSRGLAEDLLARGATTSTVRLFAGATLDIAHLPSRYPFVLVTPQTDVDQALGRYAADHEASVLRGVEAVGLEQDGDGVTVTAHPRGSADPAEELAWRATYVVGADGAHSTVRRLLGEEFPGRVVLSSVVLADVRLTHGPAGPGLTLGSTADAFGFLAPYRRTAPDGSRWFRSVTWDRHHQVPDTAPVDDAEVPGVLTRALGRDVGVAEISWRSRFHCEERQVRSYRRGRVFLAGDAAHVHSPVGGQGMNTGIQDAANLAWKLDAVLGGADPSVLDTYQGERHPVGRRVLLQSGAGLRALTLRPPAARWLRDLLAPRLLGRWRVSDVVAGSFAGTALRYRRHRGEHRLVGTRATEVPLVEGRLTELQRTPGFVLVREQGWPPVPTPPGVATAQRTDGGPALLVRPDGYVAWAGRSGAAEGGGWRASLHRWTGSCR